MDKKVNEEDIFATKITPSKPQSVTGGNKMKTIATIIFIGIVCFFSYKIFFTTSIRSSVEVSASTVTVTKGDNVYSGTISDRYSAELRVYGVTDMRSDDGWSPVGYSDFLFMGSVWTGDTLECERNDAMNADIVNIIASDESIQKKIKKLEELTEGKRRAMITGSEVIIDGYFYKGEDHSDSLKTQGQIEPGKAVLVKSIIIYE